MFDLILSSLVFVTALVSMHSKKTAISGLFFVTFGFLSGLLWVRLGAPDVAMVEIILGAGVTSLLVFGLLKEGERKSTPVPTGRKLWAGILSVLVFLYILFFTLNIEKKEGLRALVYESLAFSGVNSPVTAVLLNFRAYDTLLEVGVITLVGLSIGMLGFSRVLHTWEDDLLRVFSRAFLPLAAFFAIYLTYLGTFSAGGAFQGGSLLAGALIFLTLTGHRLTVSQPLSVLLKVLAMAVFLGFGLAFAIFGDGFLTFPQSLAALSIIFIELSIALSTALLLFEAYRGAR